MKKLLLSAVLLTAVGCKKIEPILPIERYKGCNCVVVEKFTFSSGNVEYTVKTKDSFFSIKLHEFDARVLKIGDTIK